MDSIRLRKHAQTMQTSLRDKSLKTPLKISNQLRGSVNNGEGGKKRERIAAPLASALHLAELVDAFLVPRFCAVWNVAHVAKGSHPCHS